MGDIHGVDELAVLQSLGNLTDHHVAEGMLRDAGWTDCGAGDWAIALRSPTGVHAARISPFDPAAPYNTSLYRQAAHTGQVPRLDAVIDLEGGGNLQVMEFLNPAVPTEAAAFTQALAVRQTQVTELAGLVAAVHLEARRALTWCGPLDVNPTNIMKKQDGHIVLIDPFFADGPNLYGAVMTNAVLVAATIPRHMRRHMFDLPLSNSGPAKPGMLQQMRAFMKLADNTDEHQLYAPRNA